MDNDSEPESPCMKLARRRELDPSYLEVSSDEDESAQTIGGETKRAKLICLTCDDEGNHGESNSRYMCDFPGCDHKSKQKAHLKQHKADVHGIGVVWHECDIPGCGYKAKQKSHLKQHKADVHGIGVVWHECDVPGCGYRAKQSSHLKRHRAGVHGIGVVWYECDVHGCDHKSKQMGNLIRHKADAHGIGVRWYECDISGCIHKAKSLKDLNVHKSRMHGIGVIWYECDVPGCFHKSKGMQDLRCHKADIHDIGVVWHMCDIANCNYRAKRSYSLSEHIRRTHNEVYVTRKKIQEERLRVVLINAGYREWFATSNIPPVGLFKREKRIDFKCADVQSSAAYARIDFAISTPGGLVFLEVDEYQHLYGYDASISCDMKRMSHTMETLFVELNEALPYVYWLRYNPHAYHVDGAVCKVRKEVREKRLIKWLGEFEASQPMGIGYAFYDRSDGLLDVLNNEAYSAEYACVVTDLGQLL